MYTLDEIITFIKARTGADKVEEADDIEENLGCTGDDFDELITAYAEKFKVDMSSYLWYFHAVEEGSWNSIGSIFFKSLDKRVEHIAVTPIMLLEFADKGTWDVKYPEHNLPKRRYDILINQVVVLIFIIYVVYSCSK